MGGCHDVMVPSNHQLFSQHPKTLLGILNDPIITKDDPPPPPPPPPTTLKTIYAI